MAILLSRKLKHFTSWRSIGPWRKGIMMKIESVTCFIVGSKVNVENIDRLKFIIVSSHNIN